LAKRFSSFVPNEEKNVVKFIINIIYSSYLVRRIDIHLEYVIQMVVYLLANLTHLHRIAAALEMM
jgi:hypothetical protein